MGTIVSSLGFFLADSVPVASFGLALLVIGALVLMVVPEPVPQDAFKALLRDSIRNVEIILEESGLRNRAYFMRMEDGEVRALVPLFESEMNVTAEHLKELDKPPRRVIVDYKGPRGLLFLPPGNEIVTLATIERGTELAAAVR